MNSKQTEFRILVKGKPITEYYHNGQIFVEGRAGSDYELEVKNNTALRVEAVISVDGLSIIDGKEASEKSSGYLIAAYSSIVIPGWMVDSQTVASFTFSEEKGESYVEQSTGSSQNRGVIGVRIYSERSRPCPTKWAISRPNYPYWWQTQIYNGVPYYTGGTAINDVSYDPYVAAAKDGFSSVCRGLPMNSLNLNSPTVNCASATSPALSSISSAQASYLNHVSAVSDTAEEYLGTAFGSAQKFETKNVEFERGNLYMQASIFYASRKELIRRGIVVDKKRARIAPIPQAFPGDTGCVPPKGWRR